MILANFDSVMFGTCACSKFIVLSVTGGLVASGNYAAGTRHSCFTTTVGMQPITSCAQCDMTFIIISCTRTHCLEKSAHFPELSPN